MYVMYVCNVSMYVCHYVCMYVMYVCNVMYVCMYVCTYVRMYVCTYVRMYVCMVQDPNEMVIALTQNGTRHERRSM